MYAELQVASNFSFLRGTSHPHELIETAAHLGYRAIGLTDFNTLSGVVRAHVAAKNAGITYLVGTRLEVQLDRGKEGSSLFSLLTYPKDRESYGHLCQLITKGKANVPKGEFSLSLDEYLPLQNSFITIAVPPLFGRAEEALTNTGERQENNSFCKLCKKLKAASSDTTLLSIAITMNYGPRNKRFISDALQIAKILEISPVATNDVYYHTSLRKPLQDVVTCIREKCSLSQAGFKLFQNGDRYLKSPEEMQRLFQTIPAALSRTLEIAEIASNFSLSMLRYIYPQEVYSTDQTPLEYLTQLTYQGAREHYPDGIPEKVLKNIEDELKLIHEMEYEKYFLTCHDIVKFAREEKILCQGRGAAANSAVCYSLGITSVDPNCIDILFARFITKERQEPPDIDIDFEHERREEVIQYIYKKYGRDRAAIASEVVTYRARSAVRDVGKVFGLSLAIVDKLAKSVHRWTGCTVTGETLQELGLSPSDVTVLNTLLLASELVGFPRHISQHVGGFIISGPPLCEIVPILNAGMENRTIIEWDKNDIEELGMLKIDILALGMLTCIRKALDLINNTSSAPPLDLHTIPQNDPDVYEMLCKADSLGVFQVESRAQMSMLPRLRPRCYYDLVIQIAIVRPGPVQGNMVHPYLRRRSRKEKYTFPDDRVKKILEKTLGVPIFQEQAMRLVMVLSDFTPGEAERFRRAIAAWKADKGAIAAFREKIVIGMTSNGYSMEFAESFMAQIEGFSEYGFPESHAASFALLVYASAWIKRHYPAEFACALLNSQPMGFYSPSQIVRDAQQHGITVDPIDVNRSGWDCSVERMSSSTHGAHHLRLGLRLINDLQRKHADTMEHSIAQHGEANSIADLWNRGLLPSKRPLDKLTAADAFNPLGLDRRSAHWEIQSLPLSCAPLDTYFQERSSKSEPLLPKADLQATMFQDYLATGLSLKAHPLQFGRDVLQKRGVFSTESLSQKHKIRTGTEVSCAGIAIIKQRPGTAKGVVFITIEDETGIANLIVRPTVFERYTNEILHASALLAHGSLEYIGPLIYIDTHRIESLDELLKTHSKRSLPSLSYSY